MRKSFLCIAIILTVNRLVSAGMTAANEGHPLSLNCKYFILRSTIWRLRVDALQESVLAKWKQFIIWNAGKQGRRLYRSLTPENQAKVYIHFVKFYNSYFSGHELADSHYYR